MVTVCIPVMFDLAVSSDSPRARGEAGWEHGGGEQFLTHPIMWN